jgi:hypothetical protein
MKKVLTLTLLAIMILSTSAYAGYYNMPWQQCKKVTNNYYEENNYNNQCGEADFPLYVGAEILLVPALGSGFFNGVTGQYVANAFDITDFQGNHEAKIVAHFNPYALFKKGE